MTRRGTVSLTRQTLFNTVSRLNTSLSLITSERLRSPSGLLLNRNEIIKLLEDDNSVLILSMLISDLVADIAGGKEAEGV